MAEVFRYDGSMRIRIKRVPPVSEFAEFSMPRFTSGEVYEVGPKLATVLIVAGYAEPEMRVVDRAADTSRRDDDWS